MRRSTSGQRFVGATVAVDVVIEELADVVRDDVEDDEDPARVRRIHEFPKFEDIAKMRVCAQEILGPIPVKRSESGVLFDVSYDRRDPDRRRAECLDVVEPIDDPSPITAVIARQ